MNKFHYYLYGRHFIIQLDHQLLSYLFSNSKAISPTVLSRIKCWSLTLSTYSYVITHKPGKNLGNADALSQVPQPVTTESDHLPGDLVHLVNHLYATTITAAYIRRWTDTDLVLSKVLNYLQREWPSAALDREFKPVTSRKNELSTMDGCIIWGTRVIVPPPGRKAVLEELHETHLGANRMKGLARGYMWWPKMDEDIEEVAKQCSNCQQASSSPSKAPLHSWEWPSQPWSRLHLYFAGPFVGHMYLVIVDAHSI